jgi:hypothetical protein
MAARAGRARIRPWDTVETVEVERDLGSAIAFRVYLGGTPLFLISAKTGDELRAKIEKRWRKRFPRIQKLPP